jgi:hypothetical protein
MLLPNWQSKKKLKLASGYLKYLSNLGRLNEDRFTKYYCNKCAKEHPGSPAINYENPNEELGEDVIFIEKGEYRGHVTTY